jgi:hypothetical protein
MARPIAIPGVMSAGWTCFAAPPLFMGRTDTDAIVVEL